jgi:hypothetical protein
MCTVGKFRFGEVNASILAPAQLKKHLVNLFIHTDGFTHLSLRMSIGKSDYWELIPLV